MDQRLLISLEFWITKGESLWLLNMKILDQHPQLGQFCARNPMGVPGRMSITSRNSPVLNRYHVLIRGLERTLDHEPTSVYFLTLRQAQEHLDLVLRAFSTMGVVRGQIQEEGRSQFEVWERPESPLPFVELDHFQKSRLQIPPMTSSSSVTHFRRIDYSRITLT